MRSSHMFHCIEGIEIGETKKLDDSSWSRTITLNSPTDTIAVIDLFGMTQESLMVEFVDDQLGVIH